MPAKRLSMRKIREMLRLCWSERLSYRAAGASVGCSPTTVSGCVQRAEAAGLSWPLDEELDDGTLEALLYPPPEPSCRARAEPDWVQVHRELRRKGVTLVLLWQEYKQVHPDDGYEYSAFCGHYRRFRGKLDVVMRQEHRAGEKLFVDYSGDGIGITDRATGEVWEAQLFVATLGASSYTYAEATPSQELRWWIEAHAHAFEFFGGVPELLVPDNTRTAVVRACRYEPDLNPTYVEMARHYDTAVLPARSRKPRDKAKVESAVLLAQRWILAALRNHVFFDLDQANVAIAAKLDELNERRFQKLDTTRRELFENLDRPALRPLPPNRYELAEWARPRVNIDYHVEIDRHYYSVPYQLYQHHVDVRYTTTTVEAFHKGRRVASHRRSYQPGRHTTVPEHMPKAHQEYLEWTPSRIVHWAAKTGPETATLVDRIMADKPHPQQGYRACLGILRLGKTYGQDRLEAACARARAIGSCSYKTVKSILKTGMDRQHTLPEDEPELVLPTDHQNLRGSSYYH